MRLNYVRSGLRPRLHLGLRLVTSAGLGLLLAACPGNGEEDDSTTGTFTSLTDPGSDTQTPATDEGTSTTSSMDSGSTTSCPAGEAGCPCLPGDECSDGLVCDGGVCQPDSDTTTGDETTSGGMAMCGNGMAEAGDLCLGTATPFAMGAGTIAVVLANFDADPAPDLVAANRDANTVSIRLNDGSGGFGVQGPFPTGTGPVAIGSADFDGDTFLDVVTVNLTSLDVTVLPGTGTGDFGPASLTASLGMAPLTPTDLVVTDLENDGDPDVLVTESTMSLVHVLRMDMGAFLPANTFATGTGPSAIHSVDFSGNGFPDVLTSDGTGGTVSVLLGNGFGQLGGATSATAGASPIDVASGDVNGDDLVDAIAANPGGNLTVRLGNGLGAFGGQLPFGVAGGPQAIVAADLDLDGDTDVAAACADGVVRVLVGNGGTLVAGPEITVGMMPDDIAAEDLNGDGLLDLVTANLGSGGVSVILSDA